ncbi:MAG TPA: SusC/RagA family TonB-linked outer membrane protein [Longimicrobiaceae bacterium]
MVAPVLLLAAVVAASAQQGHSVTGTVTAGSDTGVQSPVAAATVQVKGMGIETVTDAQGRFTITAPTPNDTLVVTSIGYATSEVPIDGRGVINVVLREQAVALEGLVVVGYGVQERASLSGSVSSIGSEDITRTSATTSADALAGKIQGITVRTAYGGDPRFGASADARPGNSSILQIRNMGEPLFVIDGVPQSAEYFNNLNIADIESISILKDASASIYGFRAANGVVLVTTKDGSRVRSPRIRVDGYYGFQNLTRYPFTPPANAYQFQRAWVESQQNRGQPRSITPEELELWRTEAPGYESFNQYDVVINNPNAPQYNINASASGGGPAGSYYLSVGHVKQEYVMQGHSFDRTNVQTNLRADLGAGIVVGTQLSARIENRDNVAIPGRDDPMWNGFLGINSSWPMDNPYANGNRDYINGDVRYLTRLGSTYRREIAGWQEDVTRRLTGNFFAEYTFPFGTQIQGTYSRGFSLNTFDRQRYSYDAYCYDPETNTYKVCAGFYSPLRNSNRREDEERFGQLRVTHSLSIGKHNLAGVAAFEISKSETDFTGIQSVPPSNYSHLISFVEQNDLTNTWSTTARASYIGRFNYDYNQRYLLELLGRYDGSYLYAPGKRWGFFPGVSLGWRVSEEPFLRDRLTFLDDLKLRASWGQAGMELGVAPWDFIGGATYGIGGGYMFDGQVVTGARPRGLPVTNLTWVTSTSRNLGLDFTLFGNRVTGQFDLFERKLTGLPENRYDVLVPSEVGYELPEENLESEATRGLEGMITFSDRFGGVDYSIGANATFARRRILDQYKPRYGNSWDEYRNATENRWANVAFGYEVIGQFRSMEEIAQHDVDIDGQGNRTLLPGDLIYKDVNGDKIINELDERPIGYAVNTNPLLAFGGSASIGYRGVSLSLDLAGGTMYSFNQNLELKYPFQADHNSPEWMLVDRWHRADPYDDRSEWIPGRYPPIRRGLTSHSSYRNSTFWRTNVHYLRVRRLEIGYALPDALQDLLRLSNTRIYISGTNLHSFDNLGHIKLDPEVAFDSGLRYPPQRVWTIGFSTEVGQ